MAPHAVHLLPRPRVLTLHGSDGCHTSVRAGRILLLPPDHRWRAAHGLPDWLERDASRCAGVVGMLMQVWMQQRQTLQSTC